MQQKKFNTVSVLIKIYLFLEQRGRLYKLQLSEPVRVSWQTVFNNRAHTRRILFSATSKEQFEASLQDINYKLYKEATKEMQKLIHKISKKCKLLRIVAKRWNSIENICEELAN